MWLSKPMLTREGRSRPDIIADPCLSTHLDAPFDLDDAALSWGMARSAGSSIKDS
jgi:hypothetical protein